MQNQWYIARDGKQYGPVSDADLAQLVQSREILDGDYLWRHGFENWLPAGQVHEVRQLVGQASVDTASHASFEAAGSNQPQLDESTQTPTNREELGGGLPHNGSDAFSETGHAETAFHAKRDDLRRSLDAGATARHEAIEDTQAEPLLGGADMSFSAQGSQHHVQDLVEVKEQGADLGPDARYSAGRAVQPPGEEPAITQNPAVGQGFRAKKADTSDTARGNASSKFSWPLGIGIGVAAILLLLVGATFALPYLVPPETIKKQISAILKEKTGRDVSFKGKMSYRFLPSFGLDMNNIVIHNPPGIKGPDFVSIGRLQVSLKLLPLLSQRVEVDRVVLHRPEIALIDTGKGRTNYEMSSAARSPARRLPSFQVAQYGETVDTSDIIANTLERLEKEEAEKAANDKKTTEPEGETAGAAKTSQIQVGEIEIINGRVALINQKANSETDVNAINMKVRAPAADKDVTADGTVRFREDRIALNGVISTLGPLLAGEPVKTQFNARSERFEGKFDGEMRTGDGIAFNGEADVQTFSLQNLLNWFDVDVPRQGYGGAYVRGRLKGTPERLSLSNATIKVDQSILIGGLRLYTTGPRPKIEAVLKTDRLNLDPYLSQKSTIKRSSLDGKRTGAVAAWSSDKIDLSVLKTFDAAMQLDANKLMAMGHAIEKARLNAKVNAGLMTAVLPKFLLYGGSGSVSLALNGAKSRPALKSRINLQNVQVKPLIQKSSGHNFLSGAATLALDVVSSGSNQRELISALNGTGKLDVADGAIEGLNIPGFLRNIQSGKFLQASSKSTEKTDFSELTANFSIERGMLKNEDLAMKGPLLRMGGKGVVNLPAETLDYQLTPKLVASLRGQGGRSDVGGVVVPLRVKGPWAKPQIVPDLKGALSNPEAIESSVKSVKKIIKNVKKKKISKDDMKNLLNGMIGGDGESGQGDVLDGLF